MGSFVPLSRVLIWVEITLRALADSKLDTKASPGDCALSLHLEGENDAREAKEHDAHRRNNDCG